MFIYKNLYKRQAHSWWQGFSSLRMAFLCFFVVFYPKVADVISPSWKPPRSHTRCTHLRPCAPIELPSNCQDISGHRFYWNHILPMLKILSNICFLFRSFLVVEGRKMFQELVWVASELHGIKRKRFWFYGREQPSATGRILGGFWWWVPAENDSHDWVGAMFWATIESANVLVKFLRLTYWLRKAL